MNLSSVRTARLAQRSLSAFDLSVIGESMKSLFCPSRDACSEGGGSQPLTRLLYAGQLISLLSELGKGVFVAFPEHWISRSVVE